MVVFKGARRKKFRAGLQQPAHAKMIASDWKPPLAIIAGHTANHGGQRTSIRPFRPAAGPEPIPVKLENRAVPPHHGVRTHKEAHGVDREELGLLSRCPATPRRLLTVDEYHRMGDAGILTDDDRVELIEGELVAIAPIGSEHVATTNALNRLLMMAVGDRGIVSVGNPVRLDRRNEPHPDFSVLRLRKGYRTTLPAPEDTILAVEVANTGLDFDRKVKLPLYARSGIPEVWIVNLMAGEVEVYRTPVDGMYTSVQRVGPTETVSIETIPGVVVSVAGLFG